MIYPKDMPSFPLGDDMWVDPNIEAVRRRRPGTVVVSENTRLESYRTTLGRIRDSIRLRDGLIHGAYNDPYGAHCAIGCALADEPARPIRGDVVNEVSAFNDSIGPDVSPKVRRRLVLSWLNGKIARIDRANFSLRVKRLLRLER